MCSTAQWQAGRSASSVGGVAVQVLLAIAGESVRRRVKPSDLSGASTHREALVCHTLYKPPWRARGSAHGSRARVNGRAGSEPHASYV